MADSGAGGGEATFTPAGDIMAHNVNDARAELERTLDGGANLTVDMRNVEMLDSSGVGFLITALNRVNKRHGSMRVLNLSNDILKMLEVMRLAQRFNASRRGGQ